MSYSGGSSHYGKLETVRDSLAQGADPDTVHSNGAPAVVGAAEKGHMAICDLLIGAGAKVDARAPDGCGGRGAASLWIASQNDSVWPFLCVKRLSDAKGRGPREANAGYAPRWVVC